MGTTGFTFANLGIFPVPFALGRYSSLKTLWPQALNHPYPQRRADKRRRLQQATMPSPSTPHLECQARSQLVRRSPGICLKSSMSLVTSVASTARAWAPMSRSYGFVGRPLALSAAFSSA